MGLSMYLSEGGGGRGRGLMGVGMWRERVWPQVKADREVQDIFAREGRGGG